jgi:hypothetical protein
MERDNVLGHRYKVLESLSSLPKHILAFHNKDNVTEFVMHELCGAGCFDLDKAAYFIDNPDFNCLKGIAGFSKDEAYGSNCSVWDTPEEFSTHMQKAPFNQKVRGIAKESLRVKGKTDESMMREIAKDLGFSNPGFFSWEMKHDNHGLFIYQKNDLGGELESLSDGLCYLGFCPVF